MTVMIEMSLSLYDNFIDNCDQASCEYETLKNGIIVRRPKDGRFDRIIEIHCNLEDADRLLLLASKICPAAVPQIAKAIPAAAD